MQEIINCPSCQRKLQVPDSLLGQDVQCPTCGATFTASTGGPAPLAPAAPPPAAAEEKPYYDVEREPRRREPERRSRDDYDDYEDDFDDRRRRPRRRDLLPHRGSTVLTLGILSLVVCGPILGPIAWIMGNQDMTEIRAGRMDPEGEGTTNAGRICGMIGTILSIVIILAYCLIFFVIMSAGRGGRF
jgi:hypothetical protein